MHTSLLSQARRRMVLRRLAISLITLAVIAYLTIFGLMLAERGRAGLPAQPGAAAAEALGRLADYVIHHPASYQWQKSDVPALQLTATAMTRSAGLLLVSLAIATALGVPLGMFVALTLRGRAAPLVLMLSVLGVSTPSFLLAMLLWIVNIQLYRKLGHAPLPSTGFGWDGHLIMPALVLAARPMAQIVHVTYVSLSAVLGEDYIRTARAKGLARGAILNRHALRNVLIPVVTTLSTSLRFSLASLPVVEFFFIWPGVGLSLLDAIELRMDLLVTDLIVALGLLFLLINLALDSLYPMLDPRLRDAARGTDVEEASTWREQLADTVDSLREGWRGLVDSLRFRRPPPLPPLPVAAAALAMDKAVAQDRRKRAQTIRVLIGNPALIAGSLLVAGLFFLAVFGERLTPANPYQTHRIMMIEGKVHGPPFQPSSVFPWGTDAMGRDIQALVLAGARQTLTLALLAALARMLLGATLGALAGWRRGGRLDRLVLGAVGVWAAFPVTLFAMILIIALGIQQGMSVFVIALCVVGWGEIAQFVRSQVVGLKPHLYVEAARSVGTRSHQILVRHVLPQLVPSLLVLGVLETGSVLMLLAELGFLDIFVGGGFRAAIAETGLMRPIYYRFSDVPEWGALLANIRDWWRSYPWLAWYPGLAFFLAVLACNLWGEGLRRLVTDTRINVSRLFSRYTLAMAGVLLFGLGAALQSATPMSLYRTQAQHFDPKRALADVETLTSREYQGRETGTPGARLAADMLARRMQEIGLFPAGEGDTFLQSSPSPRFHLTHIPKLELLDEAGAVAETLSYRKDFVEYVGELPSFGEGEGRLVGVAFGPDPGADKPDPYGIANRDLREKILVVREADVHHFPPDAVGGSLIVTDDAAKLQRKVLYQPADARWGYKMKPALYITPHAADRLLATAGSSLAEMDRWAAGLRSGEARPTGEGQTVHLAITGTFNDEDVQEKYFDVVGVIPGIDAESGLNRQVIIVSAYYDGLGTGPDGAFYPGANDNATGVAAMLEIARILKASPYRPKKTVLFVAWSGGERAESLSLTHLMGAEIGFDQLTVEAVIELSGLGAGDGHGIALGQGTSYRLVQLFQSASARIGVSTTTRGRGPHFGMLSRGAFGGRTALSAYVSWDGSDRTAHTLDDTSEAIDPAKLKKAGEVTALAVSVLSRETEY